MAFPICCCSRAFLSRASFSPCSLGIRLPLVGAFCMLSLGLTNLSPALTIKMGCAQSHPFLHFLRSKFTSQSQSIPIHSTGMESNASTVPSIVVYVTVPNKEVDIDECQGKRNNPCKGKCTNTVGGNICACPKGTNGNPNKEGIGCSKDSKEILVLKLLFLGIGLSLLFLFIGSTSTYWAWKKRKMTKLKEKFFQQNGSR